VKCTECCGRGTSSYLLEHQERVPGVGGILRLQMQDVVGWGRGWAKGISRVKLLQQTASVYSGAEVDGPGRGVGNSDKKRDLAEAFANQQ
jgi:predicted Rdx family selenoprotein